MTNLLEKSLLIGFGILILTIFSFIITPFLGEIIMFNQNEKKDFMSLRGFINEMDDALIFAIQNPKEGYLKEIKYPNNLNISFYDHFVDYIFINAEEIYEITKIYNGTFIKSYFREISPQYYLLNVSFQSSLIRINFVDIY